MIQIFDKSNFFNLLNSNLSILIKKTKKQQHLNNKKLQRQNISKYNLNVLDFLMKLKV